MLIQKVKKNAYNDEILKNVFKQAKNLIFAKIVPLNQFLVINAYTKIYKNVYKINEVIIGYEI